MHLTSRYPFRVLQALLLSVLLVCSGLTAAPAAPPADAHPGIGAAALWLAVPQPTNAMTNSSGTASVYQVTNVSSSGPGSLYQAIPDANANSGTDFITFNLPNPSTIVLTGTLPAITGDLSINGPGAGALVISGNNAYRVMVVNSGVSLWLSGLSIKYGKPASGHGGGVDVAGGNLSVTDCIFANNSAPGSGGAIHNGGGSLTITRVTFSNNQANYGGAIDSGEGSLSVTGSTFNGNTATTGGGAVNNYHSIGHLVVIAYSTFYSNTAIYGGGVRNDNTGTLYITNSTFSANSASEAGGVNNYLGTTNITNSTFSANSASNGGGLSNSEGTLNVTGGQIISNTAGTGGHGGGVWVNAASAKLNLTGGRILSNTAPTGGGVYVSAGSATISETQILSNTALNGGGGIYNSGGVFTVTNSTLSGNRGTYGGGMVNNSGVISLANSTLSGNHVSYLFGGGGVIEQDQSGSAPSATILNCTIVSNTAPTASYSGLWLQAGTLQIKNSIVAHNSGTNNVAVGGGTFTSLGYNLTNSSAGGLFTATGDLPNTLPLLGPLQNNGGSTWTHALLSGSPATDQGDPAFAPPPDYDQRGAGYSRVVNGRIDIGAYEFRIYSVYLPLVLNNYNPSAPPPPAPDAPNGLTALAASTTSIRLNWADNASNETDFHIEKSTGLGNTSFSEILTVGANVTHTTISSLASATTYNFRIRAHNAGGYSAYSAPATGATQSTVPLPAAPSNLTVTVSPLTPTNYIWLDWITNTTNATATIIEHSTDGITFADYYTGTADINSADDLEDPDTFHCFRIRVRNAAGDSPSSNTGCARTDPAAPPRPVTDLELQVISSTQTLLSWVNQSGCDGYHLYESENGGSFNYFGNLPGNFVGTTITGLYISGHTYAYKVRAYTTAYGDSVDSAPSNTVTMPAGTSATVTRFYNNTSYPVISLKIDGTEYFPLPPQGIPPGVTYQVPSLASGPHTYRYVTGFWNNGSRFEMYIYAGTFTQVNGEAGSVTFYNPTISQLLTRFSSAGYYVGEVWTGGVINSQAFRFYPGSGDTGTCEFYVNSAPVSACSYSLFSYPGNYNVTFRVSYGGHTYDGILDELYGYFYMSNGPSDWRSVQYTYDGR